MSGAAALDMSLDDLIKVNKKPGGGGGGGARGGRGRSSGPGPVRRFSNRGGNRAAPYTTSQAPDSTWKHDKFASDQAVPHTSQAAARPSSIETGTKLYISNLDYGVSNEDIKELLSEVGDLKRYGIHYDKSGRSKGTAEVVFSRRQDALAAVKRYNNVQLDGKPMKVEIVGTNIVTPSVAPPPIASGILGNPSGSSRSGQGRGGGFGGAPTRNNGGGRSFGRGRGGGRGGHGGGGRGRGRGEKLSAEDLDKDLDMYYAKAADAAETMEEAN